MSTIDIVNGLQDYVTLLSTVADHEKSHNPSLKGTQCEFEKTVSLSYTFIHLSLEVIEKYPNNEEAAVLSIQITFRINGEAVVLTEVYCDKKERDAELKHFVADHAPTNNFPTTTNFNNYSGEVLSYLTIADEIAKPAVNCSSGDNYNPGHFSKIIIGDTSIILEQINHWNAKSTAHKEDYHLRDLEFYIPLDSSEKKISFYDHKIGKMNIHLNDRSSKNNKGCGDQILEKLIEQQLKFKK